MNNDSASEDLIRFVEAEDEPVCGHAPIALLEVVKHPGPSVGQGRVGKEQVLALQGEVTDFDPEGAGRPAGLAAVVHGKLCTTTSRSGKYGE